MRHGIDVNFSCVKGSCHVCMLQCQSGIIPDKSQSGLKEEYIVNNYFLPCTCKPESDMSINVIQPEDIYQKAIIYKKIIISKYICKLLIKVEYDFEYKPGQYINLRRISDGLARSYSIVSHPQDGHIEIHVRKMHNGELSSWIIDELQECDTIEIQGAMGNSYYDQISNKHSAIVLIGKGTGIAPLYGIALDALRNKHQGEIYTYHEGRYKSDIYLDDEFTDLQRKNINFNYSSCFKDITALDKIDTVINTIPDPWVFIAGSPEFILSHKALLKHHNISDEYIFTDSFDYKDIRSRNTIQHKEIGRRSSDPYTINQPSHSKQLSSADDEMWKALDYGKKLKIILDDFYTGVFKDDKLSGFFANSSRQRASEKQYLFMRQLFTGDKVFFGDRPKNAHHWMVISNELFDYRESLMKKYLKKHGLAEHLIERWLSIDESFRNDIVKNKAFAKIFNGVEMPLNGYETTIIDEGTLCDGCQQAIDKGETVRYHLRLGLTYCSQCIQCEIKDQAS